MGSSQKLMMILGLGVAMAAICCVQVQGGVYDTEKYCKTADDKKLCGEMVSGAQNLREASEKAIKATMEFAKKIEGESGEVGSAVKNLPPQTRKSLVDTCKDTFKNAVDDLQLSLKALADKDKGALLARLSAALDSDCEDAVNEFGVKLPLDKEMKRYNRELENALAVVTQQ